jgi:tetratricopeptide (TPR) repeat protein
MRTAILLLVASLFATYTPGRAQSGDEGSPFKDGKVIDLGPTDDQKMTMARRMIGTGRYQEAADLLEVIYERDPEDIRVINMLQACYDHLERYEQAERMTRRLLERDPGSLPNRFSLAELLAKQGRTAEATGVYEEIEKDIDRTDKNSLILFIGSLARSHFDDLALARIDSARLWLNDSIAFAIDRGSLLEQRREYRAAAETYLPLITIDTVREARAAERKLLALLEFEESRGTVEAILTARADSTAGLRLMRLLADHYLKTDRFEEAFAYTLRQDSLEGLSGAPLIAFLRRCHERKKWTDVARMAKTFQEYYPDSPYKDDVAFEYAGALARLGRPEEAIDIYRGLASQVSNDSHRGDAVYGIGVIYMDYLDQLDSALVYFDSVTENYPRGGNYLNARRAIPLVYLRLGYLDLARLQYQALAASRLPEKMAEDVLYHQGLVDFFDGRYDSAAFYLQKVMVDFPRGYFVNDALRITLAIRDVEGNTEPLGRYARALQMEYRGKTDSAVGSYRELAGEDGSVLGDIALYRIMQLELGRGDSASALEAAARLDEEYPESYYRPLGLKLKADILAEDAQTIGEAKEIYRQILESFADYPFAREVRERLRELDKPEPVG